MGTPSQPQDHQTKTDPRGLQRLKIGGKSRLLRFDANAIIEACDAAGVDDIIDVLDGAGRMNVRLLRAGLWAGLLHEDPDLQIEDVGAWIGDGKNQLSISDAMIPLVAAVNAAIGVDEAETAKAVEGAKDPTKRGGTGRKRSAPRSPQGSRTSSSGD